MKKFIVILFVFFHIGSIGYNQENECEYYEGTIWIVINDTRIAPVSKTDVHTKDEKFNNILEKFNTTKYIQVFPYSRNEYLLNVYKIEFDGRTDEFIKEIERTKIEEIEEFIKRPKEKMVALYEPSDYMWELGWLWHLEKIQADLAWDITKGSSTVKIAIIDTWFDVDHPDLNQKISPHYDPYDGVMFHASNQYNSHGTIVASFAAAETDGGGQLASIGFNCTIIGYKAWAGDYLERAHHASLAMNADILTSSAGGWRCSNTLLEVERIAVQEILDNGTVIVMPAGNGVNGTHCRPFGDTTDQPWFPLHPAYDERIIIVSSTDQNDKHTYVIDGIDKTHSHYPEVDICAPGYCILGAQSTLNSDGSTNPWPYEGCCTGTSFATPIVAGVCALMKAIKPDLTPDQVQDIIKCTADPIADGSQYPGLIGAGRVNAYKAVSVANCDYSMFPDPVITGSTLVCTSNSTFTLHNRPPGTMVSWMRSKNLVYVSGQGTDQYTVQANSNNVKSSGFVKATITGLCGQTILQKTTWVGRPGIPVTSPDGDPPIEVPYGSSFLVNIFHPPGADPSTGIWSANGSISITTGGSGSSCGFEAVGIDYGQWHVTTSNSCGVSDTYTGQVIVPGWKFSMQPNPANDYVEIIAEKKEYGTKGIVSDTYELEIVNILKSSVYKSTKTDQPLLRIDTKQFVNGTYFIHFTAGKQSVVKQLVINH